MFSENNPKYSWVRVYVVPTPSKRGKMWRKDEIMKIAIKSKIFLLM